MKRIMQIAALVIFLIGFSASAAFGQTLNDKYSKANQSVQENANRSAGMDTSESHSVESLINPPNPGYCSKHGADSNKTLDMAFLWGDYYNKEDYANSLRFWRYMFREAPGYQETVHITGIKMFKDLIDQEEDSVKRELLIDTVLMIYDKRIECFGKEGYLLGRKGYEVMKYRQKNYDEIRAYFARSIELQGDDTEYFILTPYAKLMAYEYRKEEISLEEILALYMKISEIVDANKGTDYEQYYNDAMESVTDYFKKLGILDCDNLRDVFAGMYKDDPENPEVWRKVKAGLSGCSTCDTLFNEINKKLLTVEPDVELATRIADCETKIGSTSEALKYYDKAIELAEDSIKKASLAYAVAVLEFRELNNYPKARQYCYEALKYRPNWGDPYMLIGDMYIASGAMCKKEKPLNGYAVSWVAIDKYLKAKSVDPSVASKANQLIGKYSEYFPTLTEVFNTEYREGSSYTIGCWINETTTVRLKK